jgi:DNA-binding GntR family transcriptional regulator
MGAIRPGEYLSEMSLVERYRASRTPIREALIHLHKEGLLQRGPYRGYQVTEVSLESVRELFQLRSILEPAAARMAARNVSATKPLAELTEISRRMEEVLQGQTDYAQSMEVSNLDVAFHIAVAKASGNKKLATIITEVMNQFRRFHADCYVRSPWLSDTCHEHRKVVDAIKSASSSQAERLMAEHIRHAVDRAKELSLGGLGGTDL